MSDLIRLQASTADAGKRLDHFLQDHLPEFSRSRLQDWVKSGRVQVAGGPRKPSYEIRGDEKVTIEPADPPPLHAIPEEIPVPILYQDEDLIAVNKPSGMVVHAGAGNHSGTLVNALLHHFGELSKAGGEDRPGIVHRLDRYTSGVILIARNDSAHRQLAAQFSNRQVVKTYLALVHGDVKDEEGRIQKPITRDPIHRTRMTALAGYGRGADTRYRVIRRYLGCSYLEVQIGTGRTHQIRVHLASIGHPIVGDRLYGAPARTPEIPPLKRYFLHAHRIEFHHPATGAPLSVEAPLPPELVACLEGLL